MVKVRLMGGIWLVSAMAGWAQTTPSPASVPVSAPAPEAIPVEKMTPDGRWRINDLARPWPPRVEPKPEAELAEAAKPPAGAVILFDGTDLSKWKPQNVPWKVENGYVEVVPKSGYLTTAENFGSCRLHVEWMTPAPPVGNGQNRGNSGVFLMSRYEVQVLDNTDNKTYADGIAGSVYGENPPLAEASRPPGQWQYYDITFLKPLFNPDGTVQRPAVMTVTLNGIPIQDHFELWGPTNPGKRLPYKTHGDAPLALQEHGCADRFRNVWLVPIPDR
jgi:hypothetical protein